MSREEEAAIWAEVIEEQEREESEVFEIWAEVLQENEEEEREEAEIWRCVMCDRFLICFPDPDSDE